MEPQLPVPDLPETVLDRLHRHVAQSGGRYEEWRVGARRAQSPDPAGAVFAERVVDPTTAWIVVDHLHRLGAQPDGIEGEADEVFAYRPDAWREPRSTGAPSLVRHDLEQP